ncbi:MAG: hypothetical protein WC616_05945 [Candidatus Omnitrophota bacterium]
MNKKKRQGEILLALTSGHCLPAGSLPLALFYVHQLNITHKQGCFQVAGGFNFLPI